MKRDKSQDSSDSQSYDKFHLAPTRSTLLRSEGYLTGEQIDDKRVYTITDSGRQLLDRRKQQCDSENAYSNFSARESSELIELRRTLTELNDTVTHVARNRNSQQANQVRELLVQVKREIYPLLAQM